MLNSAMQNQQFGSGYGAAGQMDVRKPYEVVKLQGKMRKVVYEVEFFERKLRNGNTKTASRLTPREVEVDAGYFVQFPNGHSIRIADEAELQRQGFDAEPGLVDMLSGHVFMPNMKNVAKQMEMLQFLSPDFTPSGAAKGTSINLDEGKLPSAVKTAAKRTPAKRKSTTSNKGGK